MTRPTAINMFRTSAAQVVRASCRQQTFNSSAAARRFASTETKTAADKAKQSASSAFASAQKTMGSLGESGSKVLKGVQTRAEGALGGELLLSFSFSCSRSVCSLIVVPFAV